MSVMTMFLSVFMVAACGSKDKDDPTPQQNEMEKKLIGKQTVAKAILDKNGNEIGEKPYNCRIWEFMKNNSGLIKFYKGEKCNRNQKEDEISINFNWRFDEVFFYVKILIEDRAEKRSK